MFVNEQDVYNALFDMQRGFRELRDDLMKLCGRIERLEGRVGVSADGPEVVTLSPTAWGAIFGQPYVDRHYEGVIFRRGE